jgi:hypothetical protein
MMNPPKVVAASLLIVFAATASAAFAKLVRQYVGATAGGEPELVGVYSIDNREFDRRYPIGNFCPLYAEGSAAAVVVDQSVQLGTFATRALTGSPPPETS